MDKKGQMELGMIITIFVLAIIGAVFVQVIAQEVGSSINTVVINQTETSAANGGVLYIEEYRNIDSVVIVNATNQVLIEDGNYTVTNNVINPTTGALSVGITTDTAVMGSHSVWVQGTAQPLTYIADSGGRAMASLIVIMFALGLAVVVLAPVLQSKLLEMIGK